MTILSKLVASEEDTCNYITYVFECLDEEIRCQTKYVMCKRYPNWDSRDLQIGEIGYLTFFEVKAGVDTWFDGSKMIPYRYNDIQFIKFVEKKDPKPNKFII